MLSPSSAPITQRKIPTKLKFVLLDEKMLCMLHSTHEFTLAHLGNLVHKAVSVFPEDLQFSANVPRPKLSQLP